MRRSPRYREGSLNDREPLPRAVTQIELGVVAAEPVKELPGRVAQIKKRLAVLVEQVVMIGAHPGRERSFRFARPGLVGKDAEQQPSQSRDRRRVRCSHRSLDAGRLDLSASF